MMRENEVAPVFITGTWRSGSTLISRIINNHPDFDVTYETIHFMRFSYNMYNSINSLENISRLVSDTNKRIKERYNLSFNETDVIDEMGNNYTYSSVYDSIMRNLLLKGSGKRVWGEKTNVLWSAIPCFLEMFPMGRVIHIIRDPRAVLASWKKLTHAPGNDYLDSIVNCYDSMQKALQYSKQFSECRYALVTYEDLVLHQRDTVGKICKKLNIQYNDVMLDDSKFQNMIGGKWETNTVYNEKLSGIYKGMVDRWRSELKEWEIILTEVIMNELLDKFGYARSDIDYDEKLIDQAIDGVCKSELASEGMIRLLLTRRGVERYPSDPLDKKNWAKTIKKSTSNITVKD